MTRTTFTLSIELENDAMQTPDDVCLALRKLAHRFRAVDTWYDDRGELRDENGNTVGQWAVDAVTEA
jgi:hypothetical protein